MRASFVVLVVGLVVLAGAPALAHCRSSPTGASSYDTRLSSRSGRLCLHIVDVYEGGTCEGTPAWSVELSCGETSRIAITDRGRLISILAPRANVRAWSIVRVTTRDRDPVRLRLGELPGALALRGVIQLDFDGAAIRMRARGREEHVAFDVLEALADAR